KAGIYRIKGIIFYIICLRSSKITITNMHEVDLNRVEFFSKEDMAGSHQLKKGEHILRAETKSNYTDINEIFELYSIKKYIDNELYLKNWTENDIVNFKEKAMEYGKAIGQFMSNINDNNIIELYEKTL